MWRLCALPAVLALVGCLPVPINPSQSKWLERSGLFGPASAGSPDQAVLHTVLIDQPAGDPYLTTELWQSVGKPLPPETAALLAENGIRVARIEGNPPAAFLKLVTSEPATVRPMQSNATLGDTKVQPVMGPIPQATFGVATDIGGPAKPFDVAQVECGLAITPTAGTGDRLHLAFQPRMQHGAKQGWLRPTADGTSFAWTDGKAAEAFDALAFELDLGPKEYLLIGPTESPAGKLGGAFFVDTSDGRPRMRVLVVRGWRPQPTAGPSAPGRRPTAAVAAQASTPLVARGQSR
jgi:hypothetical protein